MSDGKGDGKGGGVDKSASGSSGKKEIVENNQVTGTDTFYNKEGKKLGSREGTGSNYVVKDDNLATGMDDAFKSGNGVDEAISASQDALVKMPSEKVINAILDSAEASDSPNLDVGDNDGGFHEEAGIWGTNNKGEEVVSPAKPGKATDPSKHKKAEINPFAGDIELNATIVEVKGTFHIHLSGTVTEIVLDPFGGESKTRVSYFGQKPSETDLKNAKKNKNIVKEYNIVVGARTGDVIFYNETGELITFDISVFKKIVGR
jgi:hypothetical protein